MTSYLNDPAVQRLLQGVRRDELLKRAREGRQQLPPGRHYFDTLGDVLATAHGKGNDPSLYQRQALASARNGELPVLDILTGMAAPLVDVHEDNVSLIATVSGINRWLEQCGADYRLRDPNNADGELPNRSKERPQKAPERQCQLVLDAIKARGLDPMNLPPAPLGNKPWPLRQDIQEDTGLSEVMVKKALTLLRKDGHINPQPPRTRHPAPK
jgi:hypothetical protein